MTNTVQGKVVNVHHHGHTIYGNPMMSVTLRVLGTNGQEETYRISNDSELVYSIENPEHKTRDMIYELTRAGRLSGYFTDPYRILD